MQLCGRRNPRSSSAASVGGQQQPPRAAMQVLGALPRPACVPPARLQGCRQHPGAAAAAAPTAAPLTWRRQHQHWRQRQCRCAAAAAGSSSGLQTPETAPGQLAFRLRPARVEDAQAVADLYAQVFGAGVFPGYEDVALLQQLEASYASAVGRDSSQQLADALAAKAQAAVAARAYRLTRRAALLRGQLALARGQPATFPTEGPAELRQLAKWRRSRRFVCLVAEELPAAAADGSSSSSNSGGGGGRLLGTATLSMRQATAALPPPFPSNAPLQAYVSNMAVAHVARRRGIARALAGACGRAARAWGESTVLLHVAADNTPAQQLYSACGFSALHNSAGLTGLLRGPWTQVVMAADARRLAGHAPRRSSSSAGTGGQQQRRQAPLPGAGAAPASSTAGAAAAACVRDDGGAGASC